MPAKSAWNDPCQARILHTTEFCRVCEVPNKVMITGLNAVLLRHLPMKTDELLAAKRQRSSHTRTHSHLLHNLSPRSQPTPSSDLIVLRFPLLSDLLAAKRQRSSHRRMRLDLIDDLCPSRKATHTSDLIVLSSPLATLPLASVHGDTKTCSRRHALWNCIQQLGQRGGRSFWDLLCNFLELRDKLSKRRSQQMCSDRQEVHAPP